MIPAGSQSLSLRSRRAHFASTAAAATSDGLYLDCKPRVSHSIHAPALRTSHLGTIAC